MVDAGDAVLIEADTQLGTKLNSFVLLAPDDRANMGLMDTNDPVIATSGATDAIPNFVPLKS